MSKELEYINKVEQLINETLLHMVKTENFNPENFEEELEDKIERDILLKDKSLLYWICGRHGMVEEYKKFYMKAFREEIRYQKNTEKCDEKVEDILRVHKTLKNSDNPESEIVKEIRDDIREEKNREYDYEKFNEQHVRGEELLDIVVAKNILEASDKFEQ